MFPNRTNFIATLIATGSLAASATLSLAATASSGALGYTSVTCKGGSDTLCSTAGITEKPDFVGKINAAAVGATITIPATASWVDDQFNDTHYVRFIDGAKMGHHFTITDMSVDTMAQTATLTLDLNGNSLSGTVADDRMKVVKHWTLGTLLPLEDGVIHESALTAVPFRKSEVFFPDFTGDGIDKPATRIFFRLNAGGAGFHAGDGWKEVLPGNQFSAADGVIVEPDMFIFVRHKPSAADTVFAPMGTVEDAPLAIPLHSIASGGQDNPVGLARPIPVKLKDSNLVGSGFVKSLNTAIPFRQDELLVYHNQPAVDGSGDITDETGVAVAGQDPPSVAIYYFDNSANGGVGAWRNALASNAVADDDYLMPGYGMVVRRHLSSGVSTIFWLNSASW